MKEVFQNCSKNARIYLLTIPKRNIFFLFSDQFSRELGRLVVLLQHRRINVERGARVKTGLHAIPRALREDPLSGNCIQTQDFINNIKL
jgi:hypothetical protein